MEECDNVVSDEMDMDSNEGNDNNADTSIENSSLQAPGVIVDCAKEFTTDQVFPTRDDLLDWARSVGRENGFVVVIMRSDNGSVKRKELVTLGCEKGGKYKPYKSTLTRKNTRSKKCQCPFRLRGRPVKGGGWKVRVTCGFHNHERAETLEGHTYVGRLTPNEKSLVEDMTNSMVKPKDILQTLKERDPSNFTTIKQVYNTCQAYRASRKGPKSDRTMKGKENDDTRTSTSLVFVINGERFELFNVDPSTTLLEFLRTQTQFKSVKLGCGEGGCGACLVLISKYDHVLHKVEEFTSNSCLTLLCSIHGCSITTSEGIGNSKEGFHPIHERIAGFHATQCGFCTPGMCVSLFGTLVNADKTNRSKPAPGFSKVTASEAEMSVAGNLCRCTVYRPIADACKSFAADVDMEDLGLNSFWKKGESKEIKLSRLPQYDSDHKNIRFPMFLKEIRHDLFMASEKHSWQRPTSLEELQRLLAFNQANGTRAKLVVGNTGTGYYKDTGGYDKYIDIRGVPELSMIRKDQNGIEIGAAVTISKAIGVLKQDRKSDLISDFVMILEKIADHMSKVATGFIRNTGSVGGNLVMAQKSHFPSDIATILLAAGSMVQIMSGAQFELLALEEFLERPPLGLESVLLSITIQSLEFNKSESSEPRSRFLLETYRASPRPLGSALSYLNAAFLVGVSPCKVTGGTMINTCRLSFGGCENKRATRAKNVEEVLVGKVLSISILYDAVNLLTSTIVPKDETSRTTYLPSLAAGFLFQFFNSLIDSPARITNDHLNGYSNLPFVKASKLKENQKQFHHDTFPTLLSSGKQVVEAGSEYHPVGEPIVKSGAALQASGEAVFVDDMPSPTNCLYGAYIYSEKPLARIRSIKLRPELHLDGVRDILSSKDIPSGGENIGVKSKFCNEPLFAEEIARCVGERLAFVVADTQKLADMAANSAIVDYSIEDLEPPILSVEDAVERSSFSEVPPFLCPNQVGDVSKGMSEADHKILSAEMKLGSQYYFYMETQTALAVPDEDNCITVYSSSQSPEFAHSAIARCLGIPESNVRVITRRVGGGFGGKGSKSTAVAVSCALAAQKLQRPVRIYLNRKTDMIMAGGRHPMKITYSVGFKNDGKITALELQILVNAGIYPSVSAMMPHNIVGALKKYDWGAISFDIKLCKTNHPTRGAMRDPGDVQGSFIAEAVIENVAATLSMDVDSVRNINLHSFTSLKAFYEHSCGEPLEYTMPLIWNKLAVSANYDLRAKMVKEFNSTNTWKKRGISRVPATYELSLRPAPGKVSILSDGSVVVEVGGIELGQGLWTMVKQMAAFSLSAIQCDGMGGLFNKIRVVQSDTLSLIQGGLTAGSTTSESSCEAVRLSCNVLVERLKPLKEKLQEEMGSIKWETLILQASSQDVNLSASSFFVPSNTSNKYLNYGAAVSEVEIDLLTGETRILRTDIIYDCGMSLNPAVDLGQIEGSFIQGLGFFMLEEYETNPDGLVLADGTWNYKIPTIDTIPQQFNVEMFNSVHPQQRILSSKASGELPLLLAASVHCATRAAVKEARKQLLSWSNLDGPDTTFQLQVPATMPVVKELIGLDIVERYLKCQMDKK
ncbi:indole-3-acetaldehyde oxidase-like isoform X2 [Lotus japonicus]|uniref:indole-3-acetaldehyde oxidase-like isoform X2 n=1 Tax=Lotus japonicus TaxID=34305 RepID=UPI00258F0FB6|nr:indole-3-acetaldehyde oxidase-like isoform X2 [Lotus japonicus]